MEDRQDARFQGVNSMTKENFAEFTQYYRYINPLLTVLRPLEIFFTLYLCYLYIRYPWAASSSAGMMAVFACIFLLAEPVSRLVNRRSGGIQYKRSLVSNGGRPVRNQVLFLEDGIMTVNPDTNNELRYGYDQIRKIFETKNLLVLMLDYQMCLIVNKEGLSGGTHDELAGFLLEKCTKLKKKKVLEGSWGKSLQRAAILCAAVLLAVSLFSLPSVRYWRYLREDPSQKATFLELADALETLGITGTDPVTLAEMEEYYQDLEPEARLYVNKSVWILSELGWVNPCAGGLYLQPMEENIYTDFLRGIEALAPEHLVFTMISEDQSQVDWEAGTGTVRLSFHYQGQSRQLSADFDGDWFDFHVLADLREILLADEDPRELYWTQDDSMGLLIFYRDESWVKEFEAVTGLTLSTTVYEYDW